LNTRSTRLQDKAPSFDNDIIEKEPVMNKIMKICAYTFVIAAVVTVTTFAATASQTPKTANESVWFQQNQKNPVHDLTNGVCSVTTEPSNNSIWFQDNQRQPTKTATSTGAMCKLVPRTSDNSIWFNG
jgi:uncharacterized iron-regulated membrane protein